jgi:excisionase family DNA binding protein
MNFRRKTFRVSELEAELGERSVWHWPCAVVGFRGVSHVTESIALSAQTPIMGRSVSIDQAAQLLRVSRRTIYNRIRDGRLRTIRTIGGSQRVLLDSLHEQGVRSRPFTSIVANASTGAVARDL